MTTIIIILAIWFVASLVIIAGFMCVLHSAPRDDEPPDSM